MPPLDPKTAARVELATPFRYQLRAPQAPHESAWQRIVDALAAWIDRILTHLHAGSTLSAWVAVAVLVLAGALGLYALSRILCAMRFSTPNEEERVPAAEAGEHRLAREASRAAESGDFVLAIRLLLRAAVTLLDVRGAVRDDASATLGELRRAVVPHGDAVAIPFDRIAAEYSTGVYACRPLSEDAWIQARDAYSTLRRAWGARA